MAVLTGAGISAESGIPTFRDALEGLWSGFRPEDVATPEAFERDPALVWQWYDARRTAIQAAHPNAGHLALAELERRVETFTLVTQNVDALHARAGSRDPVELHGNILRSRCSEDGRIVAEWTDDGRVPPACPRCGGHLRPDVVWFGELLPMDALERAREAARHSDLFLSVGTSNLVEPAASLPWMAARAGAAVVVINTSAEGQEQGGRIAHLIGPSATLLPALILAAFGEAP